MISSFCAAEVGAVTPDVTTEDGQRQGSVETAAAMMLALLAVSCEKSQRPHRAELNNQQP